MRQPTTSRVERWERELRTIPFVVLLFPVALASCGEHAVDSTSTGNDNLTAGVLVGDSNVESGLDSDPPGSAEAFRYVAVASGTLGSLSVFLDGGNAASVVKIGVYSDSAGNPGNLLTSGSISNPPAGAWSTVSVPTVSVTSGTPYWIAILSPAGNAQVNFRDMASGGGISQGSAQTTLTGLPSTWSPGTTWASSPMSAYGRIVATTSLDAGTDTGTTSCTSSSVSLLTAQTPALLGNNDGVSYELGTRFQSSTPGQVTAIRFWKDGHETGTHIGHVWDASGNLLAAATFSGETATGWQTQKLATPLSINANAQYTVSVNTGGGYYVATNNGLAAAITNGSLSSVVGKDGTFGPAGQYPTQAWQASNYFRDVVFTSTTCTGTDAGASDSGAGGMDSGAVDTGSRTDSGGGGTGPIPDSRRTDWTFTGVPGGIPNRTAICASFSPGATAAAINSAIAACNGGVVQLNAGTYTAASLGGTIHVTKSNVTLRGAGADRTILTGAAVLAMDSGWNNSLGTAITGGATKGSTQFTVASAANLTPGTMIEIDRDDDPNLVVNTGNQGGGTRNVTQVNAITAVSGNMITVRNPFFYDFSTGNPKVKFTFGGVTTNSGVEDIKLDHAGFSGGYNFLVQYCDGCWIKGVESANATGYHFIFLGTLNVELRDSFVHDGGSGPNNSGFNFYGNYLYGANSSARIENNIFNKNFPAIELNGSSSGFSIGYNFSYGSQSQYGSNLVTWTFDDGHAPFNIMNLYEGNIGEQWGADNYYGGTGYGTAFRNHWTGYNRNYGVAGPAVWLDRLAYDYNVVGNVLGSTSQAPTSYMACDGAIYRTIGLPNLGNCDTTPWDGFSPPGGYPDPKVTSTLLRWGNYDYVNKTALFNASDVPSGVPMPQNQALPASYLYTSRPSWFGAVPWPPIGPDVTGGTAFGDTSGHVNETPAARCWASRSLATGGSFSAAACYP